MTQTIKSMARTILASALVCIGIESNGQTTWDIIGNSGTNPATNFIGTTDNKALRIRTNNSVRMTVNSNGKVGIGTTAPAAILDITKNGTADLNVKSNNGHAKIIIDRGSTDSTALLEFRTLGGSSFGNKWQLGTTKEIDGDFIINCVGTNDTAMRIVKSTGNIGIGGRATSSRLYVEGTTEVNGIIKSNGETVIGIVDASGVKVGGLTIAGGSPASGQVLTSTGGGSTAWQTPTGGITGTGVASRVSFWSGASALSSNANLFWDNTNSRLGIGTATPSAQLEINGQIKITGGSPGNGKVLTSDGFGLASWTAAGSGTVSGTGAATRIAFWSSANQLSSSNILVYDAANNKLGVSTSVPDVRFHIGGSDDANLNDGSGEMVIGDINGTNIVFDNNEIIARNNAATSTLFLNNDGGDLIVNGSNGTGDVGIGTSAPTAKLSVNGTANKPGGGSWTVFSDSRLKKDIKPYEDGLTTVLKIAPVRYHYNELAGCDTKPEYVGVIAQDLKKIAPYMIGTFQKEGTEYFSVDNSAMTYTLINAVKEQQIQIKEKDARILLLESRMQQFENALSQCCLHFEKKIIGNSEVTTDVASLEQNAPNPFSEKTVIKFYVPQNTVKALIKIYGLDGTEIKSIPVSVKGFGQTEISGNSLSAGTYTYLLMVDGKVADTKQMILSR